MSVVNFAHGEFYTLGAYAAFAALTLGSVHFFLAIPLAIAAGPGAGATFRGALLCPLRRQSLGTPLLVLIGAPRSLQYAGPFVWGVMPQSLPTPLSTPALW